jgi:hypothetical protein
LINASKFLGGTAATRIDNFQPCRLSSVPTFLERFVGPVRAGLTERIVVPAGRRRHLDHVKRSDRSDSLVGGPCPVSRDGFQCLKKRLRGVGLINHDQGIESGHGRA